MARKRCSANRSLSIPFTSSFGDVAAGSIEIGAPVMKDLTSTSIGFPFALLWKRRASAFLDRASVVPSGSEERGALLAEVVEVVEVKGGGMHRIGCGRDVESRDAACPPAVCALSSTCIVRWPYGHSP